MHQEQERITLTISKKPALRCGDLTHQPQRIIGKLSRASNNLLKNIPEV
jgi:hypothetical protein